MLCRAFADYRHGFANGSLAPARGISQLLDVLTYPRTAPSTTRHDIANDGVTVPHRPGPDGLWRAIQHLLADPVTYTAASRAAYYRSRDYWPALAANQLLKVVS